MRAAVLSRLLLLLMLYMLQGVPFAMLQQSLPALLARSLSFGDLGILSFAMLPFALLWLVLRTMTSPLTRCAASRR